MDQEAESQNMHAARSQTISSIKVTTIKCKQAITAVLARFLIGLQLDRAWQLDSTGVNEHGWVHLHLYCTRPTKNIL